MTKTAPCPICKKPQLDKYRPFCSSRCADIDLGRWFKGSYAIPDSETVPDELSDAVNDDDPLSR